jgi:nucleoside-diphosphate-sugar epimerase
MRDDLEPTLAYYAATTNAMPRPFLFCFGLGYSARALARRLCAQGWRLAGTCRSEAQAEALGAQGFAVERFTRDLPLRPEAFAEASHVLVSIPPEAAGDPVLACHAPDIAALRGLAWLGYLSTTGVYGDRGGGWVDETSELRPTGERGRRRAAAEAGWLALWRERQVPVHVFRLAGIYGPGRSVLDALTAGTARRIVKEGQVFSRIHVEDLAAALAASIGRPRPGAVYNVCDDLPAALEEVVAFGARLLGLAPPPLVPFAAAELSKTAKSFYADNKRVSNRLIKEELRLALAYPDYRSGLAAILAARRGA